MLGQQHQMQRIIFFVEATLVSALPNIPTEKIMPLQSIIDKEVAREALYKVLDENNISHQ